MAAAASFSGADLSQFRTNMRLVHNKAAEEREGYLETLDDELNEVRVEILKGFIRHTEDKTERSNMPRIGTFRYVIPFLEKSTTKLPASAEVDWFLTARYADAVCNSGTTPLTFAKTLLKHRRILPAVNELLESTKSKGVHAKFTCATTEQQVEAREGSAATATAPASSSAQPTTTSTSATSLPPIQIIGSPSDDHKQLMEQLKQGRQAFSRARDGRNREAELRDDKIYLKGTCIEVVEYCAFLAEKEPKLAHESRYTKLVKKYGMPVRQEGPLHFFLDRETGEVAIYDGRPESGDLKAAGQ